MTHLLLADSRNYGPAVTDGSSEERLWRQCPFFHGQSTLAQHGFELCRSVSTRVSLINTEQYRKCVFSYHFLNDVSRPLTHFIVRTRYRIPIAHKVCASPLFMLLVGLLFNSRFLIVKFLESQIIYEDFQHTGIGVPNPCVKGRLYFKNWVFLLYVF